MAMTDSALLPPIPPTRQPKIETPAGACDAHVHIIGPVARFPFSSDRAYTPANAPLEDLLQLMESLGIARAVVVQGHPHGTDNRAILDALAREPRRLRGTAIVAPDTTRARLQAMADAGVRALRFHHLPQATGFSPLGMRAFGVLAPLMKDIGLHAQFMMDANALDTALPFLEDGSLPVMIDHMGSIDCALGPGQPGVQRMCGLLASGRIWLKVSAAYRNSRRYPDYDDARSIHKVLVRANPDQIVWGSDWPHTRLDADMPEDVHLLDLFNEWTPDASIRRKILVDNPGRLYRFD